MRPLVGARSVFIAVHPVVMFLPQVDPEPPPDPPVPPSPGGVELLLLQPTVAATTVSRQTPARIMDPRADHRADSKLGQRVFISADLSRNATPCNDPVRFEECAKS
jgi:hypothetical protein